MTALDEVIAALGTGRRTAGEVRDSLRASGRVSMTTADVLRVFRMHPDRFRVDDEDPPRWWPAAAAPTVAVSVGAICGDSGIVGGAGGHSGAAVSIVDSAVGRVVGAAAPLRVEVPLRHGQQGVRLYPWQVEALDAWRSRAGRGVVEAVTGTGKTMVGIAAATQELARGGQVLVLVPTRELLDQWAALLARHGPPHARTGRLGGGHRDDLGSCDVLVAVVNSAREADLRPRRPGGLLVADECHRYGSDGNRVALTAEFPRRLGLSATYARADDGHLTWLDPYFGGTCFRMGYRRAIDDAVIAPFTVDLVGVELSPLERAEYDELTALLSAGWARLIASGLAPAEPVGAFFAAVARLARSGDNSAGATTARQLLYALAERRRLLAETPAKAGALGGLVPALRNCDRAIVFTQSIVGAESAAALLGASGLQVAAIHSQLQSPDRRGLLAGFADGSLQILAAPQVLDEGVDVPAADLAVILAASRSRRQMIQRMGRVLRRKTDGRAARFVIVFVVGTVEDPALGAHEGFLDEIVPVARAVRTFRPGALAEACEHHR
ncbi:MAG: DEAD/DEAH box helicase [Nakamurella sp.]